MMLQKIISILFLLILASCNEISVNKQNLIGRDVRLYQDTPVWDLAKAIDSNNSHKIKKIITRGNVDINFRDEKYGSTLLMFSILVEEFDAFKTLLEVGADPNLYDNWNCDSAIILACDIKDDPLKYVKLLLEYGANPNDQSQTCGVLREHRKRGFIKTPLMVASGRDCHDNGSFFSRNNCDDVSDLVKLLIESGANPNLTTRRTSCALKHAYFGNNYNIMEFLIENGAIYSDKILLDRTTYRKNGTKMTLCDLLHEKKIDSTASYYKDFVRVKEKYCQ